MRWRSGDTCSPWSKCGSSMVSLGCMVMDLIRIVLYSNYVPPPMIYEGWHLTPIWITLAWSQQFTDPRHFLLKHLYQAWKVSGHACVLEVFILSPFLPFVEWILKLSRQCGLFGIVSVYLYRMRVNGWKASDHIFVSVVSILSLSPIFLFKFGTVSTACFFFIFYFILL